MTNYNPQPAEALLRAIAEHNLWQQVAELAIGGYTVLPGVLSRPETLAMRERAKRLLETPSAVDDPCGRRLWNLLDHDVGFLRVLGDDRIDVLLGTLLGAGAILSSIHLNAVTPGAPAQGCHVDIPFVPPPLPSNATLANTIWCLNDWWSGGGATEVVPGSHLTGVPSPDTPAGLSPVECEAGSVIVTNGGLWHRSGPYGNSGSLPRIGVLALYCRSFLAPQESYLNLASTLGDPALAMRLGAGLPYPFGAAGPDDRFVRAQDRARSPFA